MLANEEKLYIGSLSGLFVYQFNSRKMSNISRGLPSQSVYSILCDSRGILYAGTTGGLARYEASKSCFYPIEGSMLKPGSQSAFVNCMLEAPDHQTLYIGTGEGLFEYQPAREQWHRLESLGSTAVKSLAISRDKHLMVGTYDGLVQLTPDHSHSYRRDTRKPFSPSGNQIWVVKEDAAGNVMIGHERGISIASNSSYFQSVKINSLVETGESNEFLTVFRDSRGTLWLGGTNGVIMRRSDGTTRWHHLASHDGEAGNYCVRSVMEDSHGTVWLSTDGGIYRYNPKSDTFDVFLLTDTKGERISNWVYAIRQMSEDLWVASYLGGVNRISLSRFSGKGGSVKADFSLERGKVLTNDNISNMIADRKDCLWILLYGDRHLYRYNTKNKKNDRFDIRQMTGADPTQICIDNKNRIWCAYKGGVLVFVNDDKPTNVCFPPSGSDETALAMAPVNDGVWVSTMNNLWNIDGKTLSPSLVPIPQKGFSAIWDDKSTGKIIVGGLDEIVEVSKIPTDKAQNTGLIKMVLECADGEVKSFNNLIGRTEGVHIPYGGSLSLLVSTMDYSPDIVPHLEYRLVRKGSDGDNNWVVMPEGTSTINLTDIRFGDYEIQIKTVSSPAPPVSIPLKVGKPFWLSWWAIMLYCLLIVAITGAVFWYMRRRSMRIAQEREREETLRNVEQKLAFLSDEKHDLEARVEQLLKSREEMTRQQRLQAITEVKPIVAESPVEKQLETIAHIVEENISMLELNGAFISERCGMSEKQLYRFLKKNLNVTPSEYIRNVRMQKATMLLSQNYFTVSEVAYMVGFSAPSYFSKCFQEHFGMSPSAYGAEDKPTVKDSE